MDIFQIKNTRLFNGIREEEMGELLKCLKAREKRFKKGELILRAGSPAREVGLVLSGSVNVEVNLYWGGSVIFGHVEQGDIFAENYAALPEKELMGDVVAAEDTAVLFLDLDLVLSVCQNTCEFHRRLIQNLVRVSALKSIGLSNRMMHIAHRTIRERLLSYLSEMAREHGPAFFIPFSRSQLAEYLGVDRSALSNELSKMQRDGLISFRKNHFELRAQENRSRRNLEM